jgi:hypothetical protein
MGRMRPIGDAEMSASTRRILQPERPLLQWHWCPRLAPRQSRGAPADDADGRGSARAAAAFLAGGYAEVFARRTEIDSVNAACRVAAEAIAPYRAAVSLDATVATITGYRGPDAGLNT